MRLKDKVAIVTGGSRGIGAAICCAYAKEGAKVIVVNKSRKAQSEAVAHKICQEGGVAESFLCDISSPEEVERLYDHVKTQYGRLDILVNNAGRVVFKVFEEQTLEDYDDTLDSNLKGAFLMSKAFVPMMKKQQSGKIIFVASAAATTGFSETSLYSASKGALLAMMRAMVSELASFRINVNTLSPGNVATEMNQMNWENPEFVKACAEKTPSGIGFMKPQDMMGAAIFLASADSDSVHGLDLAVDGGLGAV